MGAIIPAEGDVGEPGWDRKAFGTQTEPPKEDVIEKPPEYDYEAQTDFVIDRPVSFIGL